LRQHLGQVAAVRLHAGLGLQRRHLAQAQPTLQIRKAFVLHHDRRVLQRRGGRLPALHCGLPALAESLLPRLIKRRIGRIELRQALRQRVRHQQDIARIGLDMRIAAGMHIALCTIRARRNFQHLHKGRRLEIARPAGLDVGIAGLAQQNRQPAGFQFRAGAQQERRLRALAIKLGRA